MKRLSFAVLGIVLLMALSATAALAGPSAPPNYGTYNPLGLTGQPPEEWGVEKIIPISSAPGGVARIITDPLVGDSPASGWVTFWCQSGIGFQHNVGATGLNPLSSYSVHAMGAQLAIVAPFTPGAIYVPGEDLWLLFVGPIHLDLGTFMTDANGLGGVRGMAQLPAGYVYDVGTVVFDSGGVPVLWSPAGDTNGFVVY